MSEHMCTLLGDSLVSVQVGPTSLAPHVTLHPAALGWNLQQGEQVTLGFCITKTKKLNRTKIFF